MILYMLDTNYFKRQSIVYIIVSIFCFLFGFVYEKFSHQVYSFYMTYAFLIPFLFGFFPSVFMIWFRKSQNRKSVNLYNASLATFTSYSFIRGFLEIYGTTNELIGVYLYVGLFLLILSFWFFFQVSSKI